MKEITRTIELSDGRLLPLTTDRDDIKELRQDLRNYEDQYHRNPSLKNYLQYHHTRALIDDAKGNTKDAVDNLLQALNPDSLEALFPGDVENMKNLLQYQDAAFLLVELLLLNGWVEEALSWAEDLYQNAVDNFFGTDIVPFAMNLYGCCLEAAGRKSDAAYMYECALSESLAIIDEMQAFRESMKNNLDSVWKQK
jgi:tetratricopeptide (TPR) repeat protein